MKFRFLAAVAAALAVFTASANVQAAVVTSNGTVNLRADDNFGVPGANPPLNQVHTLFVQNGQLFTNQVSGAPFEAGSTVRTVGVASLTGAAGPDGTSTGTLRDPVTGAPLRVIFAVEGQIAGVNAAGNPIAEFSRGSLFFTTAPANFNRNDPSTWNFAGSFSSFDLSSPTDILFGGDAGIVPAGNFNSDAGFVNNSVAVQGPGQGDGTFLFQETDFGADFINNVEMPGGGTTDYAFLAASTSQVLQPGAVTLTADQQAILNAIGAAAGFSGAFNEGGYTPTGYGAGTGDFSAELTGSLYVAAVPEPSSMAIFGLLCGGAAVRFTKRRFAKKA